MLSATYKKINCLVDTNWQKIGKRIAYLFARDIMFALKNPPHFFTEIISFQEIMIAGS